MSSRCLERRRRPALLLICCCCLALPGPARAAEPAPLRICADPDNLPYSRRDESGFENRIASVLAAELGRRLVYDWQPQRRGFVRKSMGEGRCDAFVGVPAGLERVLTTRPYYRSGYVFVGRAGEAEPVRGFDDPRLPRLRIGVQLVGGDGAVTAPGHALVQAGAIERVVGYPVEGETPAAQRMLQALSDGDIDLAIVWGPQAGYFAQRQRLPLRVSPVRAPGAAALPFEYDVAMGVRVGDVALRDALDAALQRRRAQIDAILATYGVPRTDAAAPHGALP